MGNETMFKTFLSFLNRVVKIFYKGPTEKSESAAEAIRAEQAEVKKTGKPPQS